MPTSPRTDRKAQFDPSADVADLDARGMNELSALVAATRAKVADRGASNVACVQAGLLTYRHDGEPVDFVYTRRVLHHLPDLWKPVALARIAGLLRPGGVLKLRDLVFSFEPAEAEERARAWTPPPPTRRPAGHGRNGAELSPRGQRTRAARRCASSPSIGRRR